MPEKMDFCQYYLYKCADGVAPPSIQKIYKTKNNIRDAVIRQIK